MISQDALKKNVLSFFDTKSKKKKWCRRDGVQTVAVGGADGSAYIIDRLVFSLLPAEEAE